MQLLQSKKIKQNLQIFALLKLYRQHTILRFVIVGALNTLFGYIVFSLFILFEFHYSFAIFLALLSGIIFNFLTYGNWVFYENNIKLFLRFFLVYLFLYCINIISVSLLILFHISIYLAQAIVTIPMVLGAYKLNKDFVFNQRLRHYSSYD